MLFSLRPPRELRSRYPLGRGPFAQSTRGSRRAVVLQKALRTITFDDGSEWVTHVVTAPKESTPIGVTRFGSDGTARLFLASDWLPKGTVPGGSVGQIYSVCEIDAKTIAASVGWNVHGDSRNAVLVLRAGDSGDYVLRTMSELPAAGDVAAAPSGTVVVVTTTPEAEGGGPLLTILDAEGRVARQAFPGDAGLSPRGAAANGIRSRLVRIAASRYALLDAARDLVHVFDVNGTHLTARQTIFIGSDPATANMSVLGISFTADERLLVARTGMVAERPGTTVTSYSPDGATATWISDHPWNAMLARRGRLSGVVLRNGVSIEAVDFDGD